MNSEKKGKIAVWAMILIFYGCIIALGAIFFMDDGAREEDYAKMQNELKQIENKLEKEAYIKAETETKNEIEEETGEGVNLISINEASKTEIFFTIEKAENLPKNYYKYYKIYKKTEQEEWEELKEKENINSNEIAVVFIAPVDDTIQITYNWEDRYGELGKRRI